MAVGSSCTPSPAGDTLWKDALYNRFADYGWQCRSLRIWPLARDLLTFSLRYERVAGRSPCTPSPAGDTLWKDALYTTFADLLLEVWEDGSAGVFIYHLLQEMLRARTYCLLDLLTFSLRYERMAVWSPRTPSHAGDTSWKDAMYTRFADYGWQCRSLRIGPLAGDLLTFSLRYERLAVRSPCTPSPAGDTLWKDALYTRFADLLFEVWENGSAGVFIYHLLQEMLRARTYCLLDLLTFSLRYERMEAWQPS
jgi:hypothetical protein